MEDADIIQSCKHAMSTVLDMNGMESQPQIPFLRHLCDLFQMNLEF